MRDEPMRVECGWCGLVLQDGYEPTSHGICESCKEKLLAEAKEAKKS